MFKSSVLSLVRVLSQYRHEIKVFLVCLIIVCGIAQVGYTLAATGTLIIRPMI